MLKQILPARSIEGKQSLGVVRSFYARILTLPIAAAATLLATKVIISAIGFETYGYVALIGALVLLLPFTDLGVGAAITNAVAAESASRAFDVVVSAVRVLAVTTIVLLTTGMLSFIFPWYVVLGLPVAQFPEVRVVVPVLIAVFAISLPLNIGPRILLGIGRNDLATYLSVAGPLSSLLFCLTLTRIPVPPLSYSIAFPLGMLFQMLLATLLALKKVGWSVCGTLRAVWAVRRLPGVRLRGTTVPMLTITFALPIAFQSDRILLANFSDPVQLALYALSAQLYLPLFTVLSTSAMPLWPAFRSRLAHGEDVAALWRTATRAMGFLAFCMGVGLTVAGPAAAVQVSSEAVSPPVVLFVVFSLLLLAQGLQLPSGMFLTTPTELRFQAWCVVLMTLLKLGTALPLIQLYGAVGSVLASVIAVTSMQSIPAVVLARNRIWCARRQAHHNSGSGSAKSGVV